MPKQGFVKNDTVHYRIFYDRIMTHFKPTSLNTVKREALYQIVCNFENELEHYIGVEEGEELIYKIF